jgi:hypothetical protein
MYPAQGGPVRGAPAPGGRGYRPVQDARARGATGAFDRSDPDAHYAGSRYASYYDNAAPGGFGRPVQHVQVSRPAPGAFDRYTPPVQVAASRSDHRYEPRNDPAFDCVAPPTAPIVRVSRPATRVQVSRPGPDFEYDPRVQVSRVAPGGFARPVQHVQVSRVAPGDRVCSDPRVQVSRTATGDRVCSDPRVQGAASRSDHRYDPRYDSDFDSGAPGGFDRSAPAYVSSRLLTATQVVPPSRRAGQVNLNDLEETSAAVLDAILNNVQHREETTGGLFSDKVTVLCMVLTAENIDKVFFLLGKAVFFAAPAGPAKNLLDHFRKEVPSAHDHTFATVSPTADLKNWSPLSKLAGVATLPPIARPAALLEILLLLMKEFQPETVPVLLDTIAQFLELLPNERLALVLQEEMAVQMEEGTLLLRGLPAPLAPRADFPEGQERDVTPDRKGGKGKGGNGKGQGKGNGKGKGKGKGNLTPVKAKGPLPTPSAPRKSRKGKAPVSLTGDPVSRRLVFAEAGDKEMDFGEASDTEIDFDKVLPEGWNTEEW